jgi:hypothetical protein
MDNGGNAIAIDRLDNDVHVVGQDAPGEKTVASSVKMQERVFDQLRDGGLLEPARSQASLEMGVGRRKTVSQPESHERDGLGRVETRQVSA